MVSQPLARARNATPPRRAAAGWERGLGCSRSPTGRRPGERDKARTWVPPRPAGAMLGVCGGYHAHRAGQYQPCYSSGSVRYRETSTCSSQEAENNSHALRTTPDQEERRGGRASLESSNAPNRKIVPRTMKRPLNAPAGAVKPPITAKAARTSLMPPLLSTVLFQFLSELEPPIELSPPHTPPGSARGRSGSSPRRRARTRSRALLIFPPRGA